MTIKKVSTEKVSNTYQLSGIDGYINGIDKLNTVCAPYGEGEGAVGARCLTAEDIHTLVDLLKGTDWKVNDSTVSAYWLATKTTMLREYGVSWGLADLTINSIKGRGLTLTRGPHLFNSRYADVGAGTGTASYAVRAVVILEDGIGFKKVGETQTITPVVPDSNTPGLDEGSRENRFELNTFDIVK